MLNYFGFWPFPPMPALAEGKQHLIGIIALHSYYTVLPVS
jgi:hypothetical protein